MDPAFALTYSYYELYLQAQEKSDAVGSTTATSGPADEESPAAADDENEEDASSSQQQQQPSRTALWTADTWTDYDTATAQATLVEHAVKCQLSETLQRRLPTDSQAWDQFYRHHQTHFFKDRHYLATAFPHEFLPSSSINDAVVDDDTRARKQQRTLVEIGCGVGNTLLPLLEDDDDNDERQQEDTTCEWTVYGLDLSAVAIDLLKKDPRFVRAAAQSRAWAGVADLVQDGMPGPCRGVADVATLLFCLSAIHPDHHAQAAAAAVQALKTDDGVLVVRDYGRYDQAELQLATQRSKRLTDHYYVKHDQTKCYYFCVEDLRRLFVHELGLEELENGYIQRQYQNRGDGTRRRRVWVQARFRRRPQQNNKASVGEQES